MESNSDAADVAKRCIARSWRSLTRVRVINVSFAGSISTNSAAGHTEISLGLWRMLGEVKHRDGWEFYVMRMAGEKLSAS
jgi:hypothetical protein